MTKGSFDNGGSRRKFCVTAERPTGVWRCRDVATFNKVNKTGNAPIQGKSAQNQHRAGEISGINPAYH